MRITMFQCFTCLTIQQILNSRLPPPRLFNKFSILGCLHLGYSWLFNKFTILGCLELGGDVVALQLPLADHKVEVLQLLLGHGDRRRDPLVFHLDVAGLFKSSLNKKEFW